MMRSKRIDEITAYVYQQKTVTLDKLCQEFGVSKNTIRRDINEITAQGSIKKIYGGVTVQTVKELISFDERNIRKWSSKQRIAAKAAELIDDGDIIFVDSGTTTCHIIDYIKNRKNLTLITNNLELIIKAIPNENVNIICLSGTLNRGNLSFVGHSASAILKNYNISKSFMAATGLSIENGASNSSPQDYEIKQTAIERSKLVYMLADSNKFDVVSLMTYCPLDRIDVLVTDEEPPVKYTDYFNEHGNRIIVAGKADEDLSADT